MDDLISRQAAIDVCNFFIDLWRGQLGEGITIAIKKRIADLPSAQAEIVHCRECKYAHLTYCGDCKYCDKWLDDDGFNLTLYLDGDFYCGYAERRTDEGDRC